eukprot:6474496-Amphidinium_carterae.1
MKRLQDAGTIVAIIFLPILSSSVPFWGASQCVGQVQSYPSLAFCFPTPLQLRRRCKVLIVKAPDAQ